MPLISRKLNARPHDNSPTQRDNARVATSPSGLKKLLSLSLAITALLCGSDLAHAQLSWSTRHLATSENPAGITFGAGNFFVIPAPGDNPSSISCSSSGLKWRTFTSTIKPISIASSGGRHLVALSNTDGRARCSADGGAWFTYAEPKMSAFDGLSYSGGRYVGTGYITEPTLPPPDIDPWDSMGRRSSAGVRPADVSFGEADFDYIFYTDTNLVAWSKERINLPTGWYLDYRPGTSLSAFGNDTLVICASRGDDPVIIWQSGARPAAESVTRAFFVKRLSSNTWTQAASVGSIKINAIRFLGGQFVAVGSNGSIYTSPDGVNWTQRSSGSTASLNDVAFGKSTLTVVGDAGAILTSRNKGVSWVRNNSRVSANLGGVSFGSGVFVATGPSGAVLKSN